MLFPRVPPNQRKMYQRVFWVTIALSAVLLFVVMKYS
jgi:hypothetical protein